jgi:hypothetical protein
MVYILYMKRTLRCLAILFGISTVGVAIFAFYGGALQSSPLVQQLSESCYQVYLNCLEIYRNNPTIGEFLIAGAVGIPAGLALSMVWPRNGLLSLFQRRESHESESHA